MNDTIFDYNMAAPAVSQASSWGGLIVVGMIVLVLLVALLMVAKRMLTQPELHGMSKDEIRKRWTEIEKVSETGVMGAKMAIVEADKLLDTALKSMAMAGTTLGERLKFACYKYPELRKVWPAHKLRNQLVHETTFDISSGQARAAINEYRKALRVLHVL